MTSVGVPIKILHEAEGHTVTVESSNGEVFRGKLVEAEDQMNCQLRDGESYYFFLIRTIRNLNYISCIFIVANLAKKLNLVWFL